MKVRQLRNGAAFGLMLGLFVGCCLWGCASWRKFEAKEDNQLNERRAQDIKVVIGSRLGSPEMRNLLASDFLERITNAKECRWSGDPTWGGESKNPNWFSSIKGSNGFLVTCETTVEDEDGHEDKLVFKWDVSDSRGVVGFRWGYSAMQEDQ